MKKVVLLVSLLIPGIGLAGQYSMVRYKASGGGGTSSNGQYRVNGAIGQPVAGGAMTGGNYFLTSDFWSADLSPITPILTWTNPPSIVYGTALGSNQLDATANVPGGFAYGPPAGAVLSAGTNLLSVVFTPADTTDYSSVTTSVAQVVTPAALSVAASNASRAYGQNNPVFGGTIRGVQNGDNITAVYSCSATSNSPVGTYAIVPSLADPGNRRTNYTVSLTNGTLAVTMAAPLLTWTNPPSIVYGTALGSNQLDATANVPGGFAYGPPAGAVLSAGTNLLSVVFTPADTTDYSSVTTSVAQVVTPAALSVTASNASRAYGQNNPVFGGTIRGVQNGDNITAVYSCSATSNSPVGTYAIVPSLADPGNRRTNYTVSLTNGTLAITMAAPLLTWTNPPSIVYGTALGSNQLDATANVPGGFAYGPPAGAVLSAGTNLLSVVFTPADTTDYSSVTTSVAQVVTPAALSVAASNASRAYGQGNPVFGGTIRGVQNGDNITAVYSCSATSNSPVGTYAIVPSLADPGNRRTNYTVSLTNGTLAVTMAAPLLSWTPPSAIVYGTALGSNQLDATANVPGGFAYGPPAGAVLSAGTNLLSVVFTPADTTDYSSVTTSVAQVVTPAALSVAASNASRAYGQNNPVFGGTIRGVQNGDNITAVYSCSATSNSPVGTYAIVPSLADPGNRRTNYTVSLTNGTLAVTMAAPLLSWTPPSAIVYGTALGSNQLDATANVPGGFAYGPPAGAVLSAGTNLLSVVFTPADTTDYSSVTTSVAQVVTPAALSVAASNASRAYGQNNPVFGGTIRGVQNGDNITAVYSCSATSNSPVGTYAIVPSLADPGNRRTNYTVSLTNGTLAITMAAPLLTWTNPPSIVYGTALGSNQLDATANVPGGFAYGPPAGAVLSAGTNLLSVVFTPADTTDYSSVTTSVAQVVTPAALSVAASNASRAYGQNNPVFGGTISGLQNGDNITAVYSCSATSNSPVGTYAIVPSLADPGNRRTNYTVSLTNGTLAVTMAAPLLSWTPPSAIVYGTALGSNQLDATANVPGGFAYGPPAGAVLSAGTNLLSVVFTPADTTDYSSVTTSVAQVVTPAALSVAASNASRAYGQGNPVFGGTIRGVQNGDNITAVYSCSATSNSPVGTYAIVPSLADPGNRRTNYTVSLTNGTLAVTMAAPLLSWTPPSAIVYGTALGSNQLDATANVPGGFAYGPPAGAVLSAGTNLLSVVFTPADTTDYSSVTTSVAQVVTPAALSVAASNASRAYGQNNPVFGGTIRGVQNGDNITAVYSCSATSNSPVGTYAIVPSLADPGNRRTNYTVSLTNGTLAVTMAAPLLTWTNPPSIVYGTALGSNQLDATANVPGGFAYGPPAGTVLSAGTNLLSVVFTPADTTDYSSVTTSVAQVVTPAALSVAASNASRAYGQNNPVFGGTIRGVQNGDNITAVYSCSATSNSPVGTYAIVPSLADPGNRRTNYTVSLTNGTLAVTMAAPLLTWTNPPSIVYGTALGSNQLDATANVPGGFAYGPPAGAVLSAGTNLLSVVFTPADTTDYSSVTTSVAQVVTPAALSVAASNASRAYGQNNPVFGGTIRGVQNGDNITAVYSCSATSNSPVGTYAIVPSLADPGNRRTNYTVSLTNGTLAITMAAPLLTWTNPPSIVYGTALGSNQLDATANVPGGFAYGPPAGTVLSAGTNLLSVVFTPADTTDYSSVTTSVAQVVTPAALSVAASNASRAYGQNNPVFGGTIRGVQNGDNITAVYSCSATSNSPVGTYAIVPSLADPGNRRTNYTVSLTNGTLAVTMAAPLLSWTPPSAIVYGTALGSNQLDATANVPGGFAYGPPAGTVLSAGTNLLSVVFTPADTTDYSSVTTSVAQVVTPAALSVTASNASRAYGQGNPVFGGTISGLQNGDNITAVYSCSATSNSPVGTYAIVPSLADPGNRRTNYTVSLTNGTLTVFAPPVIQTVGQSGSSFTFTWIATSAQLYQIQTKTNLNQPDWTNLGSAFTATNSTMTTSESIATNAQQFYRVVLLP